MTEERGKPRPSYMQTTRIASQASGVGDVGQRPWNDPNFVGKAGCGDLPPWYVGSKQSRPRRGPVQTVRFRAVKELLRRTRALHKSIVGRSRPAKDTADDLGVECRFPTAPTAGSAESCGTAKNFFGYMTDP